MKRRVQFKSPSREDIVIFERTGSEHIKSLVLKDQDAYVLDSALEEVFISPVILMNFLLNLRYLSFCRDNNFSKQGLGLIGQLRCMYLLGCLQCMKPKVVMTMIDNYPVFHWLSEHFKSAEFMAIQNGTRTMVEFKDLRVPYTIGHFFCFGEYEKDMYQKMGHKIGKFYPVGSFLSGYYPRDQHRSVIQYDICVVSCWRGNIGNRPDVQETMQAMRTMDMFLARYIKESKLKACVIMRSEPKSSDRNIPVYGDEKEYFKAIYPEGTVLIDPDFKARNIYPVMDQADCIISFGSTALREAFGWGKKVLYCDLTKTGFYTSYDSLIVFRTEQYESLKARLDQIRHMTDEEYRNSTGTYASYLMSYDPQRPAHLRIKQVVDEYLGRS